MTIIATLAVFAVSKFNDPNALDARGYYDELISAVRYAQRYAVASGCPVAITINANDYVLTTQGGSCGVVPVQDPSGNAFMGTAPPGVSVVPAGIGTYSFDASGDTGGGGVVQIQGGGSTYGFTITANTGFVQ